VIDRDDRGRRAQSGESPTTCWGEIDGVPQDVVGDSPDRRARPLAFTLELMLAGSICEETDCTELLLIVLALALAALVVAIAVAVVWAIVISSMLARRGWSAPARQVVAVAVVVVTGRSAIAIAEQIPDLGGLLVLLVAVPPVPLLIRQRRLRRRDQSSPCSTA
jgi:hypothetical protein